jgi:hypothetical protein
MSTNAYDDFVTPAAGIAQTPQPPSAQASPQPGANAYADFVPAPTPAQRAAAAAAAQGPVTFGDRAQALEAGILKGGAYLAGLPADTLMNAQNVGRAAAGGAYSLANTTTTQDPMRTPGGLYHYLTPGGVERFSKQPPPPGAQPVTQTHTPVAGWADPANDPTLRPNPSGSAISELMDMSPITTTQGARPDDAVSRYLVTAGSVVPAAIAGGGGAIAPTARVLAGALPSAVVGQTVAEARPFQSDTANNAASVLAQVLTSAAAPAAAKLAIRGVSPATMQANLGTFQEAGAQPSLGQAAGTRRMQFLESGLSKLPGSAGVMDKFAEQQAEALRGGVDQTVEELAPGGVSPEIAGRAITQGTLGEGGFRDQFNAKASDLFGAVDEHMPPDSQVAVSNTLATLDKIAKPNPLAPQTTAALINPKVAGIRQAMLSDLGEGGSTLPYSSLADLRSRVGSMLTGSEITTDIPRAQVKQLYGALSSDMQQAAADAGPQAVQAFNRAQNYYRAGMQRMDTLANVLDRNGGPEQVFNGALSGTKDGATTLRAVMQSLAPEQQQVVASTVFKRMGQATAGNQNAAGDVFSPTTFLTNYNRMSPEAKSALFDRIPGLQESAENLADVAENLRAGSQVFRNASGTAAAEAQTHTLRDVLVGSLMGEGGHALLGPYGVALASAPVAANLLARGVTSPTVVNWAARPALGSASQAASGLSIAPILDTRQQQQAQAQRLAGALQGSQ